MLDRIRQYPVRIYGLIVTLIALGTSFGLDLTAVQVGAITAVAASVLTLVTENFTTPVAKGEGG